MTSVMRALSNSSETRRKAETERVAKRKPGDMVNFSTDVSALGAQRSGG
jgi:hypothetical protein